MYLRSVLNVNPGNEINGFGAGSELDLIKAQWGSSINVYLLLTVLFMKIIRTFHRL